MLKGIRYSIGSSKIASCWLILSGKINPKICLPSVATLSTDSSLTNNQQLYMLQQLEAIVPCLKKMCWRQQTSDQQLNNCRPTLFGLNWENCWPTVCYFLANSGLFVGRLSVDCWSKSTNRQLTDFWGSCSSILPFEWTGCVTPTC